jgi:hypothetical protein
MTPLAAWESFYIIIGSSSAALTGLMFVVITLVAESRMRTASLTFAAFATPNIVHFCAAFFVSAILTAPWRSLWQAAIVVGVTGVFGVTYIFIVWRRARRQSAYKPVFEDWLWHTILPLVSYLSMLAPAVLLPRNVTPALFMVAAATILLLFIGIHNAWDTVVYTVQNRPGSDAKQ